MAPGAGMGMGMAAGAAMGAPGGGYPGMAQAPNNPMAGGYPGAIPSGASEKDDSGSLMDDLNLGALIGAVTAGTGFAKPRMLGAALGGLGVLFLIANIVLIFVLNIYFPYLLVLVPIFGLSGLFMLATGEPARRKHGAAAPGWTRIGLGACLFLGLLIGVGLVFLVKFGGE
jgi:hypothetical protein